MRGEEIICYVPRMPFIERDDGAKFYYEEAGGGGPPLLFVHGIGCNLHDFEPLMAAFQARHRVVAVDLRGHGMSSATPEGLALEDHVADVRWLCRELGLHRPILVGHSLGGIVGVELSRETPPLLSGVVSLDGAICLPAAAWEGLAGLIAGLHGDDWRQHLAQGIGGYADPTRNPQRHRYLLDRATSTPQVTFTRAFDTVAHWQADAALSASRLPLLYVASLLPVDEEHLLRLKPDVRIERVKAGHYPHVEAFDEVLGVIDTFLSTVASARQPS